MSDAQQTVEVTDADVTSLQSKMSAFRASLTPAEIGALQAIWSKGTAQEEVSGYDFTTFDPTSWTTPVGGSKYTFAYKAPLLDLSGVSNLGINLNNLR